MIRVVLDTNIVVSALLRSGGMPHAVFNLAVNRLVQICISEPILAEYEEVASRPRLKIAPAKLRVALAQIRSAGLLVAPKVRVTAAIDPDDNIFLECAAAAKAHYLVTGNQGDFPPEAWGNVRIITARHFLGDFADWQRGKPPD